MSKHETTVGKLTPEMVDAGVEELCARERARFGTCASASDEDLVTAIYLAMEAARVSS